MPVTSGDIHFRLSVPSAAAGNTTAQATPSNSLGKWISTTDISSGSLDNLFDDVTGDENATLSTDYRCCFVYNASSTNTLLGTVVWLSGQRFTTTKASNQFNVTAHGYNNGDTVRIDAELSTDTMPGGFNNTTTYYVISATTNAFELSLTNGGAAVTMSADGTGAVRRYGTTTIAIAIDNVAASAVGSAVQQADTIASDTTAPSAVGAFSSPTTKATGLSLGDIPAGDCRAIWVKRTATNSSALNNDGATLGVQGDTTA